MSNREESGAGDSEQEKGRVEQLTTKSGKREVEKEYNNQQKKSGK